MSPSSTSTLAPFQQTAERASQVEELLRTHPRTETLNRDATLFQLPLTLPGGVPSAIRIALPSSFPATPPTLSLTNLSSSSASSSASSLRHTWVDATSGLITCPSVASWDLATSSSTLSKAVEEAFEALREGGSSDSGRSTAVAPPSSFPVPPSSGETSSAPFPELSSATEEQLSSWLTDEAAFAELSRRVAARVRSRAAEAAAATSNDDGSAAPKKTDRQDSSSSPDPHPLLETPEAAAAAEAAALASLTLTREQELKELTNQVAVVRATALAPAAAKAAELRARARVVSDAIAPRALVDALKNGAAQADAASTRCYDAFLAAGGERGAAAAAANAASSEAGQRALDAFLDEYLKLRTKIHERELKQQAAEQTLL